MSEEIVDKIADKLGIAASDAANLITQLVPQYAAAKAASVVPFVVLGIVLIVVAVALLVMMHRNIDTMREYEYDDFELGSVILASIGALTLTTSLCFFLPYVVSPAGATVVDVLAKLGGAA